VCGLCVGDPADRSVQYLDQAGNAVARAHLGEHVNNASFTRLDTKGQYMSGATGSEVRLVDYLEKHEISVPGRHFSPVPLSKTWLTHLRGHVRSTENSSLATMHHHPCIIIHASHLSLPFIIIHASSSMHLI
jgi:hypothetical protein